MNTQRRVILLVAGALTVLGMLVSVPGAFASERHDYCDNNGLPQGVYPPKGTNPGPGDVGTFDMTFDPTTALEPAKIAGKLDGPPWTGALLCGTDPAGDGKFFYQATITSEPNANVHCANPANTSRYCENQARRGAVAAKGIRSGVGIGVQGIAQAADDIPDGKFVGRGYTDFYCDAPLICTFTLENYDQRFKTFVDYDTSDNFPGGYGNRCTPDAIACYEARFTLFVSINCNSDTIVTRNPSDPRRVDLTIYDMACDTGVGKDAYLMAVNSFNLCQYAGEKEGFPGTYTCGEDLGGGPDPSLWMQTNGFAGPWTYSLEATLVDRNGAQVGSESAVATGAWT